MDKARYPLLHSSFHSIAPILVGYPGITEATLDSDWILEYPIVWFHDRAPDQKMLFFPALQSGTSQLARTRAPYQKTNDEKNEHPDFDQWDVGGEAFIHISVFRPDGDDQLLYRGKSYGY